MGALSKGPLAARLPKLAPYARVGQTWWWVRRERNAMPKLPRLSLSRVVIILAALLVGYFIFAAVGDTVLSQRMSRDEQRLQQEVEELRRDQAKLEAIRDYLWTDEYIEGVARRLHGLVRPGETLIVVSSNVTPTPLPEHQPDEESPRAWWEELYGP